VTAGRDRQADGLRDLGGAPRTPWVAVAGAKGGVGKTALAVNLALLFARAGHRTLLVDLDPGCGDVDVHLRFAPAFTVEDLAAAVCTPAQAIVDGPAGLRILAGRSGSPALCTADAAILARTLDAVERAAAGHDVVVCDTGAGIGPAVLAVAERADLVLGVTTPEPAAVTDAYALCKRLQQRGRPMPRLVVNAVRSRDEAMRTAARLGAVCERFLGAGCALLGWVHADERLARSVALQQPFALSGQGPAQDDLRSLAAAVLSALPALVLRPSRQLPRRVALRPAP
jgi:flagellar biosynthesis protein FlhG